MGPADVPQDGGDDEVHVGEAVLFPGTTEVWTKGPANVKIEAGQVLLPVAGVYWDSPSTAVPAFGRTII